MTIPNSPVFRQTILLFGPLLRSHYNWLLASGLIGLSPLIVLQTQILSSRPHLQFFPVAWIFLAAVIVLRGAPIDCKQPIRCFFAWLTISLAATTALLAAIRFSPWAGQVALTLLLLGWALLRLGGNGSPQLVGWISVFAITVPLPMNLDSVFIQRLQAVSTRSASCLLDLAQVPHLSSGNILEIRSGKLFVDEACSGIDSLYALLASSIMVLVWQKRTLPVCLVTLFAVPLWAWLGNLTRIFLIAFLIDRFSIDLSEGTLHQILGLALFAFAFACVFLTQNATERLMTPFLYETPATNLFHRWFNRLARWPRNGESTKIHSRLKGVSHEQDGETFSAAGKSLLLASTCLLLAPIAVAFLHLSGHLSSGPARLKVPSWSPTDVSHTFTEDDLPINLNGLIRTDFHIQHRERRNTLGEHSVTWTYTLDQQVVQVSLDFPFPGFHNLEVCYLNTGRELARAMEATELADGSFYAVVHHASLQDDFHQLSALWYLNYDERGNPVTPLKSAIFGGALSNPPIAFQVQVYVQECNELNSTQRLRYQETLVSAAQHLLPKVQQLMTSLQ